MRNADTMTISLPPEIAKQVARVQKKEHRTPSELLHEAWRVYVAFRYPQYVPSKSELAAIRKGRAEFECGEYMTLDQLHDELATARNQKRKKATRTTS